MPTKMEDLVEYIARQVIQRLLTKADKANTYTKDEIDAMITLLHPEIDGTTLILSNVLIIDNQLII